MAAVEKLMTTLYNLLMRDFYRKTPSTEEWRSKMALNLCLSSSLIMAKSILKRFLLYVDKQIEAKLMLVDGRVSKSKKESRYGSYGFIISLSLLTKLPVETSYVKLQK